MQITSTWYKLKQSLHLRASVLLGPTIFQGWFPDTGMVGYDTFVWQTFLAGLVNGFQPKKQLQLIGRGCLQGSAGKDSEARPRPRGKKCGG